MIILLLTLLFSMSLYAGTEEPYIVSKVKIKSSLLGKDRFLQHYLHEAGDRYDDALHKRSLTILRDELIDDGYLAASVKDTLSFDEQRKTVLVTLQLDPGTRYTITAVNSDITGRSQERAPLKEEITELLEGPLVSAYIQKKLVDEQGKRLRSFLVRKGYVTPHIALHKQRDDERSQITLSYTISLSKRQEFRFLGNTFFSNTSLLDDVLSLEEYGISLPPSLIAQDIEDLYKKKGFTQAKVEWQEEKERATFYIAEGPRHTIGRITIKEEFTDPDVIELLQQLEHKLSALPAYDEENVDRLLNQTTRELADLGYWDVVLAKQVTRSSKAPKIDITITIAQSGAESGTPHRMMAAGIKIPGYDELLCEGPFASWQTLSELRPVCPADIDAQRRWLVRYLRDRGYLLATVTYAVTETDDGPYLVWTIDDEAGPVRFGEIQIAGLHKMKPFIVRRELCFQEGDVWDGKKLEASVKRLKGLSMFESIAMHPQQIVQDTSEDGSTCVTKPILIKCCEDDPIELRTRFGLQLVSKSFTNLSWTTWKLGGSFIWKNPTGFADRLILDADWTRYTRDIAASYEVPWIGPVPLKTQVRVYTTRFDQPLISNNHQRLYKEAHDGASVTFHHKHPWWTICVKTGFEVNTVSGIRPKLAPVIQFEPTLVDRPTPYFYLEPSVTFEHFDNKNDPTQGFFSTFTLKAMVPPGVTDGWFVRALLEQSLFYPLYRKLIGAVRWRFGHIFNAKFSTILPTQRFYLGGANSLRGYETNMAPPLNDVVCDGKTLWAPVGGKTMANVNTELRFPLYKRLSGVLFTDMGILTQNRIADIAANRWLGASGFGLRFASPVGPIRFDIGWKWKKRLPTDKAYAFFFTFGHAF